MRTRGSRLGWGAAVALVCVLAGYMFATAHTLAGEGELRDRSADLSTLIRNTEARLAAGEARAADLQRQLDEAAAQDASPRVAMARAHYDDLRPEAQLSAVHGPGLQVTLSDAPRDADGNYPLDVNPDDLVVHQQDVQSVVNALWVGGAEAMTIMGQRVLTTSAVRCIGNTLLLQGRTYSPPFVITAIGPQDRMRAALDAQPGVQLFRQYVQTYGLGYEISPRDDVTMPGFDGPIRMSSASPGR